MHSTLKCFPHGSPDSPSEGQGSLSSTLSRPAGASLCRSHGARGGGDPRAGGWAATDPLGWGPGVFAGEAGGGRDRLLLLDPSVQSQLRQQLSVGPLWVVSSGLCPHL